MRLRVDRWHGLVLLSVCAVVLALFPRVVLLGQVFFERDVLIVWIPQTEAFVQAVAKRSWPVWDPTLSFGQPLLANPNTQVFYPFTWLSLVISPELQYALYAIAHVCLAALGAYRLASKLGASRAGALTAGCLYAASGPFLSLVSVWHHLAGAAWLPWVMLAAENALAVGTASATALWASAMAVQVFAGSPDLCVYTQLVLVVQLSRRLVSGAGLGRKRLLAVSAGAYVLAGGLTAAQWLPTLAVALHSARMALSSAVRGMWSLHPAALVQTLFPLSFEGIPQYASGTGSVGRLFELWSPFMASAHLGLAALALVALALAGPRWGHRGFLLGIGTAALMLALGHHTPLHDLLARALPPVGLLRYPSKALVIVALSWSLLAARGLDVFRDGPRLRSATAVLALAVALGWTAILLPLTGLALAPLRIGSDGPLWTEVFAANRMPLLLSTALATAALALVRLSVTARSRAGWAAALGTLAVLDLAVVTRAVNTTAERRFVAFRPPILDVVRPVPGREPTPRVYVWDYVLRVAGRGHDRTGMIGTFLDVPTNWPRPLSFSLAMVSYLYPPSFGRWGLAGSYDRDLLGLYSRPLAAMALALREVEDTPGYLRLLQIGGVEYVLALHEEGQYGLAPLAPVRGLYRKPIRVFRVPDPLPRTYAVGCARSAPSDAVLPLLLHPAFDPRREIVLTGLAGAECEAVFHATSRIVDFRPDRVGIEAELSAPGWVVLLETYEAGWTALVDGVATPVRPANAVFRAVRAPAGRHRIELVYRPRPLLWGLVTTGVFLVAGAAAVSWGRSRSRPT